MNIAIIITSVIYTSSVNWTYAQRSVYTPQQRYEQSLLSIASIKHKMPDAHIYFIEGSELPECMSATIKACVYKFINTCDSDEYAQVIHTSPYKGHGEAIQTLNAIDEIEHGDAKYDYVFKLSGRYELGDAFDVHRFIHENPTFCGGSRESNDGICSTVVYSVPWKRMNQWKNALNNFINYCTHYKINGGYQVPFYELMFPPKLEPINKIFKCAARGCVAVAVGDFFNCS